MVASTLALTSLVYVGLYFIGSIPTGYWFCKAFFNLDITTHGSGNIGATNVARVLGSVRYFFLIFLIDAVKAYCGLAIASFALGFWYSSLEIKNLLLLGACMIFLGNAHSIFLRFKGGKGIATLLGLVCYLLPAWLLGVFVMVWAGLLAATRRMYIASLGGSFALVAAYWMYYYSSTDMLSYFLLNVFIFLVIRHKRNIFSSL